jgi:cyclic-di-GMP-binding protein
MASTYSFDVVSEYDRQELVNALDQANREIGSRYDLKDTKTEVVLAEDEININTSSEFVLDAVVDIVQQKALKRGLSIKIFDAQKVESASGGRVRQTIKLKKGLTQELAKQVSKIVRDTSKATAQIQGDAVRVVSKNRDELQAVIQTLKAEDFPAALQFTNYR